MSAETLKWLNTNTLIGYTDKRGNAWHYRASEQGDEPNHYPGAVPVEDVLRRLFHWSAEEVPLQYTVPERITLDGVTPAELRTDETRKVVYRSDTGEVMGVFSESYERHQFTDWLLDNVANILDDDLGIGSAGLLMGGAVGWVQVEMPENITGPGGIALRPYLLAMTSHNGKIATGYANVVQNVVCDNTLRIADNENGRKIKYKHTRNSGLKIADAREALGMIEMGGQDALAAIDDLLSIKVSDQEWQKFLDTLVPMDDDTSKRARTMGENKIGELNRLYKHDERVAPWAGTGWGVMQAVNTYEQHYAIARNLGDGNKGEARYGRSLLAVAGGDLDKQAATVRQLLHAVTA